MRLLSTSTLRLENVLGENKPKYAILSHTWSEGELLFEDLTRKSRTENKSKPGYLKVRNTCDRALRDGYQYVWIDTCCIDKSSSAELSEAINSMFEWYRTSDICYAFLSDVADRRAEFHASRWFTRGWTLQELIAPDQVTFLDANWQDLGDREQLSDEIYAATNIERAMLLRPPRTARRVLDGFSVAQRMRWASKRETSRPEDVSYCLMGLFDVNMPLLYGEGQKAFRRLQEAIIAGSTDHSILAFRDPSAKLSEYREYTNLLADNVARFCDDVRPEWVQGTEPPRYENGGIVLIAYVAALKYDHTSFSRYAPSHVAYLDFVFPEDYLSRPAILLRQVKLGRFVRCSNLLLKATATRNSRNYLTVVGRGIPFGLPINRPAQKEKITIETGGLPHQSRRYSSARPIILDFSALKQYCEIGPSHPVVLDNHWCLTVCSFVGVVTLKFESQTYLVFWGKDARTEGYLRPLEKLRRVRHFAVGKDMSDEDAVEAIVRHVRQRDLYVDGVLETINAISGHIERRVASQHLLGLAGGRLEIGRDHTTVEFMDREVHRLELTGKLIPEE